MCSFKTNMLMDFKLTRHLDRGKILLSKSVDESRDWSGALQRAKIFAFVMFMFCCFLTLS